jgi:hypothetical protein
MKHGTGCHEEQREELLDILSHILAVLYNSGVLEQSSDVLLAFM